MITLIMNNDKTLKKTISSPIYKSETSEKIIIFIPQMYNGVLFNDKYTVNLFWLNSNKQGDIIPVNNLIEIRSDYLQYEIVIPISMSSNIDDLTVWIEISNKDGYLLKSGTATISISSHLDISEFFNDTQLSLLDMHITKMNQYDYEFEQKKKQIYEMHTKTMEIARLVLQMYNELEVK